jgi:Zn-dependent protease
MSAGHDDDPLARLAAEEEWRDRVKAVERDAAKARRKARLRVVRPRGASRWRPGGAGRSWGRGISWIFLALLGVTAACGVALWTGFGPVQLMVFLFVLGTWLIALSLHEFSHALTAHYGGDDTVAGKGYLRLDLRRYGHPVLTFGLPILFLILGGLPLPGGAVMIESHRLRNRFRDALVSAAGPAVNVVLAAGFLTIVSVAGPDGIALGTPHVAFWAALSFAAWLQVATAILNLIPMPGLDGYGIIEPYLSGSARHAGRRIAPFGLLVLIVLLYLPPVGYAFNAACDFFVTLAGAPLNAVDYGAFLFKFWRSWGR